MKKIGILFGMEDTFPWAFVDAVNARRIPGVEAEVIKLGGTRMNDSCTYRVIVDRISHEIKYYRAYLKHAALYGTYVINNPFWWSADDKFFECAVATSLGVEVPRTVVLPSKSYPEGVVERSLRNLVYPLHWKEMLEYTGLPAIMKPVDGGGWKHVYKIHSLEELLHYYDQTGPLCMILQEFIDFEHYVRCFCIGKNVIIPVRYDPRERKYIVDHRHLTPELGRRIVEDARKLNEALDYDMNTVEFAIKDGVPYAIDFLNPAPDFDLHSITQVYFNQVVEAMADLVIEIAQSDRTTATTQHWYPYLREHGRMGLESPSLESSSRTFRVPVEVGDGKAGSKIPMKDGSKSSKESRESKGQGTGSRSAGGGAGKKR